jgi:hypothetical protein
LAFALHKLLKQEQDSPKNWQRTESNGDAAHFTILQDLLV